MFAFVKCVQPVSVSSVKHGFIGELTAQVVAPTDHVQTYTSRLTVADKNQTLHAQVGSKGGEHGVFDKKRLYPKELKEAGSLRSWSERCITWFEMDNAEIGKAFHRAGKQESALGVTGLTPRQTAYSKAIYGHLRFLTEGFRKAAKIVRLGKGDNGLEARRKLVRKLDPQDAGVHAAQLEHIVKVSDKEVFG